MRRVLVTGASSGIGLACARAFLGEGETVIAHYRSGPAEIDALVAECGQSRVRPLSADLSSEAGCVALCANAGPVDVLVHSAGIWNRGEIRTLSAANLEEMYRVNTFSAYYLVREVVRSMTSGCIVLIGSTAGQRGEPGHGHYAGSKAALWGLVQSLAQELAPNIRVNLVSPGWVRTPMAEATFRDRGRLERILAGVPLHRVAEPEDVASAVLFLAAAAQRHVTGIDLAVSGGALLPLARG